MLLLVVALDVPAAALDAAPEDVVVFDTLPHAAMKAARDVAAAPAPTRLPAILRKRLRSTSSRARRSTMPGVGSPASVLLDSVIGTPCSSCAVRSHPRLRQCPMHGSLLSGAPRRSAHDLCPGFGGNPARLRTDPRSGWRRGQTPGHSVGAGLPRSQEPGGPADYPRAWTGLPSRCRHADTQLADCGPARSLH